METKFHFLARAFVYTQGRILLVRVKGSDHTFLPGGHVEFGESVPAALSREMCEELGEECKVGEYLGAVENAWEYGGIGNAEMNHVFRASLPALDAASSPRSLEGHIEFLWSLPEELEVNNLKPEPLRECIHRWIGGSRAPWWGSTIAGVEVSYHP